MRWIPLLAALLLALAGCGPAPLTLRADGPPPSTFQTPPPPSTFQTPPPRATDYPLARPRATAQIRGTVTP